jgi:hypothetical protein
MNEVDSEAQPGNGRKLLLSYAAILIFALLAVLPLLLRGPSCGHDFEFHLQSWLDAAQQLRHGTLDPQWAFSPAWNAGEPRFVFYPPASWLLGAFLSLIFPFSLVPAAFTWIALSAAGLAMFRLARAVAPTPVALLASAIYLANPYMLFTAFERTAYGELLAAAWLPLLLLAAITDRPTLRSIALPIALLWLTNAPAAVIGCYAFVLIIVIRLALRLPIIERTLHLKPTDQPTLTGLRLATISAVGVTLGLALAAFYVLPAAFERRYVQIAMAIIPNMRYQDNFLFGGTGDIPHDTVLRTASWLSVSMLALTALLLIASLLLARRRSHKPTTRTANLAAAILITTTALLLTRLSTPIWHYLPELAFLQFPWRLVAMLGVVLGLSFALATQQTFLRRSLITALIAAFAVIAIATTAGIHQFRQPCERTDPPAARASLFTTHHGVEATDEYTPTEADNDVLRWDDPAFWLAAQPNAPAPNTVPNPAATIINYDAPPPLDQTISAQAPSHLQLQLAQPSLLVLNLRAYPAWIITRNGEPLKPIPRDDGLLAVTLPSGPSHIDITWHTTPDHWLGIAISLFAALALAADSLRSRKIKA